MTYHIIAIDRNGLVAIDDSNEPLADIVSELLNHYWEDNGTTGFLVQNRDGEIVASLLTAARIDVCHGMVIVTVNDGTPESVRTTSHRVRYQLDADGHYAGTVVEALDLVA